MSGIGAAYRLHFPTATRSRASIMRSYHTSLRSHAHVTIGT
jgi:hypothetical protein